MRAPASEPGVVRLGALAAVPHLIERGALLVACEVLALALLVARVGRADNHHSSVPADHGAVLADHFDARFDFHESYLRVVVRSAVAVDNPPARQVVRREFDHYAVLWEDSDVVLPHLAADVSEYFVAVGELHPEHGVRE